jgi:hypothetical protein
MTTLPSSLSITDVGRPILTKSIPRFKTPNQTTNLSVQRVPLTIGEILEQAIRRLTQRHGRMNFTLQELWEEELPRIREELENRSRYTKSPLKSILNSAIITSLVPTGKVSRLDRGVYEYHPPVKSSQLSSDGRSLRPHG